MIPITAPLLEQIQQLIGALADAKRTIRALQAQIYGVRAETSQVILTHEGQTYIDPSWGIAKDATPPAPPAAEPKTARTPRDRRGLAQRFPQLTVKDEEVPVPAEIQEQVTAGSIELQRTGTYHDELVKPTAPPFIRRIYDLEVIHLPTREVSLQLPQPDRLVPNGFLADETIGKLIIGKFLDAIPFHRQWVAWKREGLEISRKTVNDAVQSWVEVFEPLAKVIYQEVLTAPVVHADESWARVQAKGDCDQGNIWTVIGGGQVAYRYTPDRPHDRVFEIIPNGFTGNLVVDAWPGWFKLPQAVIFLCNAHARRPFATLITVEPENAEAKAMVGLYRNLAMLKHQADEGPPEGRVERLKEIRTTATRQVMEQIKALATTIAGKYSGKHPLAVGSRYILEYDFYLTRFLTNPLVPPDNNQAENALRINALIRKNSMFFGSHEAAKGGATAMTILHSCRLAGVEPHHYLRRVTPLLLMERRGRPQQLAALTPLALAPELKESPPS